MQVITLTNGKKVANFSSPHPFTFTDGTVLPAVSDDMADYLKVTFIEHIDDNGDTSLTFALSSQVRNHMTTCTNAWVKGKVDVVFCPLPMITAMHDKGYNVKNSPFRAVRIEDRIKKLISIDKQCI